MCPWCHGVVLHKGNPASLAHIERCHYDNCLTCQAKEEFELSFVRCVTIESTRQEWGTAKA